MTWPVLGLIGTVVCIAAVVISALRLLSKLRIGEAVISGRTYRMSEDPRSFWGFFWTQVAFDIVAPTGLLLLIWFG